MGASLCAKMATACAIVAAIGRVQAATVMIVKSDESTRAVGLGHGVPDEGLLARLDAGDAGTLSFAPAMIGDFGTLTPIPPGAPNGTALLNIPPGDGQNGFLRFLFTLPSEFPNVQLAGSANADDVGRLFLNGQPITPSILGDDSDRITQFGNATFSVDAAELFTPGTNVLLLAVANTLDGPSGAALYATVSFTAEPASALLGAATWIALVVLRRARR